MILFIMGILDLVCMALLFVGFTELMPYAGMYLIIKGLLFAMMGDWMSWVDVSIGLYLILMCFGISWGVITFLCVIYLAQKSLFSLIGG